MRPLTQPAILAECVMIERIGPDNIPVLLKVGTEYSVAFFAVESAILDHFQQRSRIVSAHGFDVVACRTTSKSIKRNPRQNQASGLIHVEIGEDRVILEAQAELARATWYGSADPAPDSHFTPSVPPW